jgi:NAD(P)-dependent dehydrogenase (short-subunit alcohol dehydrogenase family)
VVNNAGVGGASTKLLEGAFDGARQAMEVNYFGTWAVARAFAPVLARNGGGALVNMLSVASWVAELTMDALLRDQAEVLADEQSRSVKAALSEPVGR